MVDPHVVQVVRELLASTPRRVLVTGGTGFVGSRVGWLLAEAGQQVTLMGRNRYRLGRALHPDARFVSCDLADAAAVRVLCREQDVVIHAAADTSVWGSAEQFERANVEGTRNVVDALRDRPDCRLVHVSSTAIHFEYRDKRDVEEATPLPPSFACEYAASKWRAEEIVRAAIHEGMNAVLVRARAVFGPGDNSLLPRLLAAARRGRLPQIGDGRNVVDLTYIDNLAYALCLAIVRGTPGSVCTITNGEPVELWPTVRDLLERLRLPVSRRRVPYRVALALATAMSAWHRWRCRPGEPTLTRYGVGLLATSQTFSGTAAERTLGYQPLVPMGRGVDRTLSALTARDDQPAAVAAEVTLFTTGYTPQPYFLAERGQGRGRQAFHALCALIRHPRHGLFLFDTGYAPRFLAATADYPYRLYGKLSPVVVSESLTIRAQLAALGIPAEEIRGIVVSHFHADHVAGLRDFPRAEFIVSRRACDAVAGRKGWSAVSRAFIPALLPDDWKSRVRTIEHYHDPGIGAFEQSHDLFGDGSVRLVDLSGHATGQMGALVQTGANARMLLAADATWTLGSLRRRALPHPLTYSFVDSVAELRESLERLATFSQQYPDIDIVPTHCPEIARRYGFEEVVGRLAAVAEPAASPVSRGGA